MREQWYYLTYVGQITVDDDRSIGMRLRLVVFAASLQESLPLGQEALQTLCGNNATRFTLYSTAAVAEQD
jgi:hypothetical protein